MTRPSPPAVGWYVEVETSSGDILRPSVAGDPQPAAAVNGRPELRIPVPPSDKWTDGAFEDVPMRAWHDGVRQPIDTLATVSETEGTVELVGTGGAELEDRVAAEYDAKPASDVATDLLGNVNYTADVDAYDATVETNQQVQSADTTAELEDALNAPISATDPLEITSTGELQPLQTCWTVEGENFTNGSSNKNFKTEYSGSTDSNGNAPAIALNTTSEYAYWDFTPDYDIPEADVGVWVRAVTPGSATPEVVFKFGVKGNSLTEIDRLSYSSSIARLGTLNWRDHAQNPFDSSGGWSGGDLSAGTTYRLRIDIAQGTSSSTDSFDVDVVAPADNRFSYTFDDTVTTTSAGNALDGPELYPDAVDQQFADAETVYSVSGGRVEATLDDTSNNQAVALSNDFGKTWTSSANTGTLETDFTSLGPTVRFRVTLSRYGSQASTPRYGINPQSLNAYTLKADLDDTPLIVQQKYDAPLIDTLQSVARTAGAVFEFTRDSTGSEIVSWTYPGQRQSNADPSAARYRYSKTTEGTFESVTVRGGAVPVQDERFDANHGNAESLTKARLLTGRETVYDPTTSPRTTFSADVDYEIDTANGTITTYSDGSMTNGTEYAIDFEWRPEATADVDGVTNPRETVEDIPALATKRGCGQAALRILNQVDTPLEEGQLTILVSTTDWSVVEALTSDVLPTTNGLDIKRVEPRPGETTLVLGSRETVEETVQDVRHQLRAVSQRV